MRSARAGAEDFELPGQSAEVCTPPSIPSAVSLPPSQGLSLLKVHAEDRSPGQTRNNTHSKERIGEHHPLISWFEQELRPELADIRKHLDQLLSRVGDRAPPAGQTGPKRRMSDGSVKSVKRPSLTKSVGDAEKTTAFRRAMSNVSCMSASSIKSDTPSSALGAVLCHTPDGSKLDRLRNQAFEKKDLLQVMPGSSEPPPANSGSFDTVRSINSGSRRGGGRRSMASSARSPGELRSSSELSKKELEKAEILNRFQRRRLKIFAKVWSWLEDPEAHVVARWCARLMPAYVILTVCVTLLQTVSPPPLHGVPAAVLEITIESIFLLEFLVRLVTCPNQRTFWLNVHNLIDLAAAAPLAVRAALGPVLSETNMVSWEVGLLLCAVPIVRMLKLLRRFEKFHLLLKAFSLAAEALPVLLFMLFVIELVFSVLIYLVEPRENIPSLPTAIWLTMVTMTTVGYGDVTPTSTAGSIITGVLVVITVLYMAVPLGIIGNAFTVTWNERDRILLMQRTRDRLRQWGYTAHDIPVLFRLSDSDDDGELDVTEFRDLLKCMNIGFSDERIFQLFNSFDQDHSGTVDDKEFVRALFPNSYHEIYLDDIAA